MNNFMGRNTKSQPFKALTKNDGTKCTNREENAEIHADRLERTCSLEADPRIDEDFTNIVNGYLAQHFPNIEKPEHNVSIDDIELTDPKNTMLTSEGELKGLLSAIKPTGAAGPDGIDHFLLKRLTDKAIKRLTLILNACVAISYFPQTWKLSWVTMIPNQARMRHKAATIAPSVYALQWGKFWKSSSSSFSTNSSTTTAYDARASADSQKAEVPKNRF